MGRWVDININLMASRMYSNCHKNKYLHKYEHTDGLYCKINTFFLSRIAENNETFKHFLLSKESTPNDISNLQ